MLGYKYGFIIITTLFYDSKSFCWIKHLKSLKWDTCEIPVRENLNAERGGNGMWHSSVSDTVVSVLWRWRILSNPFIKMESFSCIIYLHLLSGCSVLNVLYTVYQLIPWATSWDQNSLFSQLWLREINWFSQGHTISKLQNLTWKFSSLSPEAHSVWKIRRWHWLVYL